MRLRIKLHGLVERNPTKLVDDALTVGDITHTDKRVGVMAVEVPPPATKIVEKPVRSPLKKFNEIDMRQEALQQAQATANRIVADKGAEAAALTYAIRSGRDQNPNFLT